MSYNRCDNDVRQIGNFLKNKSMTYLPTKEELEEMGFYQDNNLVTCDRSFTKECSFAMINYKPSCVWKWYIE